MKLEELTNQELSELRKGISEEFTRRQKENSFSSHHMFSMPEIRTQLEKIFGDEKPRSWYKEETKRIHSLIPTYKITLEKHKEIHGKKI